MFLSCGCDWRLGELRQTITIHNNYIQIQNTTKRELPIMPSLYSNIRNIANSYFDSLSTHGTLADCYSQSIDSIPENVTYLYGDDDLESTKGP
jgi:hypothetical protein